MKKILSIFMVAVLSLNLLYQPCVAAGDKKEEVSAVKQESQKVVDETSKKSSDEKTKTKTKGLLSYIRQLIDSVFWVLFVVLVLCMTYTIGYNRGQFEAEVTCDDTLRDVGRKAYDAGYMRAARECTKTCDDTFRDVGRKAYEAGYKRAARECTKRGNFPLDFPLDKMPKKCLNKLRADLHPDKFTCFDYIKGFYNSVNEEIEKRDS